MKQWRLLVVDDEELNLEIIKDYLDEAQYSLHLTKEAASAWRALEQSDPPFDLAILDRMMPGIDGIELMRRMKADERFKHIPVIMQTAAATPEQVSEGIAAGAYYYLTKPYAGAALIGIVRAALESVQMRIEHAASIHRQGDGSRLIQRAEFRCATLEEAGIVTAMISAMCPDPATAATGITELIVNGIEHGNLGISYAEKKALKLSDSWEQEVERRSRLKENRDKFVSVEVERAPDAVNLRITDQGTGFDWKPFLVLDHRRAFDPNGRGIAIARVVSFAKLEYQGRGNIVAGRIAL